LPPTRTRAIGSPSQVLTKPPDPIDPPEPELKSPSAVAPRLFFPTRTHAIASLRHRARPHRLPAEPEPEAAERAHVTTAQLAGARGGASVPLAERSDFATACPRTRAPQREPTPTRARPTRAPHRKPTHRKPTARPTPSTAAEPPEREPA
jgi:hypothetical protein